jgi:hypothetical protein
LIEPIRTVQISPWLGEILVRYDGFIVSKNDSKLLFILIKV